MKTLNFDDARRLIHYFSESDRVKQVENYSA